MNKKFSIYALVLPALILTGCAKEGIWGEEEGPSEKELGRFSTHSMLVNIENQEKVIATRSAVDVSSFMVEISDEAGKPVESFKYGQMPEVVVLPVGDYNITAHSPENPIAAWDTPYLSGSSQFSIAAKEVTDAETITCKLSNVRVSVFYDDELRPLLGDDCKVNVKVGSQGEMDFSVNETRSAYFAYEEGSNTLVAALSGTIDGFAENTIQTYTDVAPGNHYKITFKYHHGDVPGSGSMSVGSINIIAEVETESLTYDLDIADDILKDDMRPTEGDSPVTPGSGPDINADPYEFGRAIYNNINPESQVVIKVKSDAPGGLQTFTIDIDSALLNRDELEAVGLGTHLDLAHTTEWDQANGKAFKYELENTLGLPVDVAGTNDEVICDVTGFMPLLALLGSGTHTFVLTVGDANGTFVKYLNLVMIVPE